MVADSQYYSYTLSESNLINSNELRVSGSDTILLEGCVSVKVSL